MDCCPIPRKACVFRKCGCLAEEQRPTDTRDRVAGLLALLQESEAIGDPSATVDGHVLSREMSLVPPETLVPPICVVLEGFWNS